MAVTTREATRNKKLNQYRDDMDAGAGPATLKVYTGSKPATPETAIGAQVLLGTLTFSDPCAADASGGVLTFSSITQDPAADASGTAAWARVADSNGVAIWDGTVTAVGGGGDFQLNIVSITAGGPIQMTSATLTEGP